MPLRIFSSASSAAGRLVVGADAGREVAVEVASAQQRRMAVDVAIGEALELRDAARIGGKHPGDVHELGEPKDLRVIAIAQKVGGLDPRARGLELGCRDAARELHAQVHDHALGRGEEIVEGCGAEDVRHLVRVADRRRDPARQHAALELERRDERGLDMQMGVDEARHGDAPAGRRSRARRDIRRRCRRWCRRRSRCRSARARR